MEWGVSSAYWFSFLWIYTAKELLDHNVVLFLAFSAPIHYPYNNHNNEVCVCCACMWVCGAHAHLCALRGQSRMLAAFPLFCGYLETKSPTESENSSFWPEWLARAPRICLSLLPHKARLINTCSCAWLFFCVLRIQTQVLTTDPSLPRDCTHIHMRPIPGNKIVVPLLPKPLQGLVFICSSIILNRVR